MEIMTNEQLTQKLADLEARMNAMPAEVAGKFEKALDETFSQAVAETVLRTVTWSRKRSCLTPGRWSGQAWPRPSRASCWHRFTVSVRCSAARP
jgi:hypothetical protein